ncbi:MAG: hypothetical protein ACI9SC_002478 [Gammaproteobacteria bacterium]|jgi:hypothetical protein
MFFCITFNFSFHLTFFSPLTYYVSIMLFHRSPHRIVGLAPGSAQIRFQIRNSFY